MRKILIAMTILAVLAGCGDSGGNGFVSTNSGVLTTAGGQPPGVVINSGTGPVLNQNEANQRILNQFLNIRPRQIRAQVVGGEGAPFLNAYSVPGGAVQAGVPIFPADEPENVYTTDQAYFLFWVDPNPIAMLGHQCSILYLRASDGLLIEQEVEFDPNVGGDRPLEDPDVQAENLIYAHEGWIALNAAPGQQSPAQAVRPQIVGDPNGVRIGGLGVTGALEREFANGLGLARNTFVKMGGQAANFKTLLDTKSDRATRSDLERMLREASADLGPDDKFFFVLITHASRDGKFRIGKTRLSWRELCEILNANVSAGNINIVLDSCYSGQANAAFEACAPTSNKRMRIISTAGENAQSFSERGANGTGFNLRCTLKMIEDGITEATQNNVPLLLELLEAVFLEVKVTKAQLDEKVCAYIGDPPPTAAHRQWKKDYNEDLGTKDKIKGAQPGKSTGFDSRPTPINDPLIVEFFDDWGRAVSSDDPFNFNTFYQPGYNYNGQTPQLLFGGGGPGSDVEVRDINLMNVGAPNPTTGFIPVLLGFTLTVDSQGGLQLSEDRTTTIRLERVVTPANGPPFLIISQQPIERDIMGTFAGGLPAPPFPQSIDIEGVNISTPGGPVSPGQTLNVGEQLTVDAQISNLLPFGLGGGSAEVVFGGLLQTVTSTGGNNYSAGTFSVPNVPTGFYLLEFYAENGNEVDDGMNFARSFTAKAKTIELFINNPTP